MAIIFAIIFLMIALRNKFSNRHLLGEIERLKAQLTEAENEKDALMDKIAKTTNEGGIGESTVLAIAGEIARMENNLYRMKEVPGRKQVLKALDRMKVTLQAESFPSSTRSKTPTQKGSSKNTVSFPLILSILQSKTFFPSA